MRALVLRQPKSPVELETRADLEPGPGEVVVALRTAALNRRDFWITRGLYPGVRTPVVLGSDGAGVVTAIHDPGDVVLLGREVVINPSIGWGDDPRAQADDFRILGMPDDGTFATEIAIPADQVFDKPAYLSWPEAAALPLAGLTAFRALFRQAAMAERIEPDGAAERVLVTGIGGGVATFALQFAVAAGAEVFVTSSSPEKIERAIALGATAGEDYTADGWDDRLRERSGGGVDVVIDGAGGKDHAALLELAAPGGRIVHYGSTAGAPRGLDLFKLFWKQLRIVGSTMGSPEDFRALLAFVEQHGLRPIVDSVAPLDDGATAIERMERSPQFGKLVLET